MRALRVHVVLVAAVVALPLAVLAAATDQDTFRGKVEKFTSDNGFDNPKRLCVCIHDDNPQDERMAGVLVDTLVTGSDGRRRIQVRCFVRRFATDGSNTTSEACTSTWAPLK
jgi:hypothetical protein